MNHKIQIMISRRQYVPRVTLTTAGTVALLKLVFTSMNSVTDEYLTMEISHGKIRGVRTEGVNIFKGVLYAGRISGDRRFRQPCPFF